jgi:hypothetical protein
LIESLPFVRHVNLPVPRWKINSENGATGPKPISKKVSLSLSSSVRSGRVFTGRTRPTSVVTCFCSRFTPSMLARLWSGSESSSRSGGRRNLASRAANVDYPVPPLPVAMKIRPAPSAVDVCRLSLAASAMMRAPNSSSCVIPLYPQRGADRRNILQSGPWLASFLPWSSPRFRRVQHAWQSR